MLDISFSDLALTLGYHDFLTSLFTGHLPSSPHTPTVALNLRSFRLVGAECVDDCIMDFLADHPKLQSIEIRSCILVLGSNWSNILLNSIKPLRELNSLIVGNLRRNPRLRPFVAQPYKESQKKCQCLPGTCRFNKDTMATGIDRLIRELDKH